MNIKFYNSILSCLFMELESKEVESVYKATVDDSGKVVLKKKSKIRRGSKARATGSNFELKVRKDLQRKDWTEPKTTPKISGRSKTPTTARATPTAHCGRPYPWQSTVPRSRSPSAPTLLRWAPSLPSTIT